jgi:DNA invertase Pin-like site-specific DNA recombinase
MLIPFINFAFMKHKNAILIVRVSTDLQDFNAQVEDLQIYAKNLGYENFKLISTKESGLADLNNRDGLNELFEFLDNNKDFDTIFITELSRLGRRQSILQLVREKLVKRKIQLVVKDANFKLFETDDRSEISNNASIMFTLYALFAENEIKTKKDRFIRKRKELMSNGTSFYGGKVLFGYELFKEKNKNRLVINQFNANIIRTIYDWYLNGIDEVNKNPSVQKISRECVRKGFPSYTHSKRNINKLLHEQGYTGYKITSNKFKNPLFGLKEGEDEYKTTSNEIYYPQIISKETFDDAQSKMKLKLVDKKTKHTTILSNLITCNSCGRKLSANYRKRTNSNSYRCTSRTDTKSCSESTKSISMALMDNLIWHVVKLDKKALINKIKELNPNIKLIQINNEIDHLKLTLKKLNEELLFIENILLNTKFNSINVAELVESNIKRLGIIDKNISSINEQLNKLEIERINIERNNSNTDSIVYKKTDVIEKSIESIKEYINQFVKEIIIKKNTVKYSIIQIEFKYFTSSNVQYKLDDFSKIIEDDILDNYITLLVDKTNTNNISFYKFNKKSNIPNVIKLQQLIQDLNIDKIELKKINFNYE